MKLSRLVESLKLCVEKRFSDVEVSSIECDSRRVKPGSLFVAVSGVAVDGNEFVSEAARRGAVAVMTERESEPALPAGLAVVKVPNARVGLGQAAAVFYDEPSLRLATIGITGTSGKTTTSYLIQRVLNQAGKKAGLLGTVVCDLVGRQVESHGTTPDPLTLQRSLGEIKNYGGQAVVMEVSSHSLDQRRVRGVDFDAAVFTNLSQDHLDYHGDMETYFEAKKRLFLEELPASRKGKKWNAVNLDDPYGRRLWKELEGTRFSFGFSPEAHFRASNIRIDFRGTSFHLESPLGNCDVVSHLIGRHNVYNLLAAAAATAPLGLGWGNFAEAVREVRVPGRLEPVLTEKGSAVFVDYAHCEDALSKALTALRPLASGKLLVVFGCGGDRDKGKREKMGRAAGQLADHVIVTSDNPRSEDPGAIIDAIVRGLAKTKATFETEADREKAIRLALERAQSGDLVLIAGKGHEKEQIFSDRVIPFDDKKVAEFYARAVI